MKNKSINFVASSTKDNILILGCVVFFIATCSAINAANIGYQTLVDCCTSKVSDCSLSRIGGDSLPYFNYFNFHSQMTKNNENASKAKYSNRTSTPTERNTVSYSKFLIEKNAKNKAYYFLLSHGFYNQFVDFCANYRSSDPHKDCINVFTL